MAGMIPVELQARIRQLVEYAAANGIVHGGNNPIVHGAPAGGKVLAIYLNGTPRASIYATQGMTFDEVKHEIKDRLRSADVDFSDQHRMEIRADFHNGGGANPPVPVADERVWRFIFSSTIAPRIDLHVNIEAPNVNPAN